ncbi:MAG: hypothetical protein LBD47_07330 [Treponema sp.]|jgi:hypothetical protein|nr:hypothetical protein [Treponema sp.]
MIVKGEDTIREVAGLSQEERERISAFLQGAVYCWCKNRKEEWFSMLELMGGDNNDWTGTPLQMLHDKEIENGKSKEEAYDNAGKNSGWLLKKVIFDDKRRFETEETPINRRYRWLLD